MIRRLILTSISVCCMLSGCTLVSLNDLRTEPPVASKTYKVNFEELGNCFLDRAQSSEQSLFTIRLGNLRFESIVRKRQGIMTVTGYDPGEIKVPWIDLLFIDDKFGNVIVETRHGGVSGGSRAPGERAESEIWPIIDSCVDELK